MTRPTKVVINCETNEEEIVDLSDAEMAELEQFKADAEQRKIEREAAETAQAEAKASALAKLSALGLTEDEVKAIAG